MFSKTKMPCVVVPCVLWMLSGTNAGYASHAHNNRSHYAQVPSLKNSGSLSQNSQKDTGASPSDPTDAPGAAEQAPLDKDAEIARLRQEVAALTQQVSSLQHSTDRNAKPVVRSHPENFPQGETTRDQTASTHDTAADLHLPVQQIAGQDLPDQGHGDRGSHRRTEIPARAGAADISSETLGQTLEEAAHASIDADRAISPGRERLIGNNAMGWYRTGPSTVQVTQKIERTSSEDLPYIGHVMIKTSHPITQRFQTAKEAAGAPFTSHEERVHEVIFGYQNDMWRFQEASDY